MQMPIRSCRDARDAFCRHPETGTLPGNVALGRRRRHRTLDRIRFGHGSLIIGFVGAGVVDFDGNVQPVISQIGRLRRGQGAAAGGRGSQISLHFGNFQTNSLFNSTGKPRNKTFQLQLDAFWKYPTFSFSLEFSNSTGNSTKQSCQLQLA